MLTFLSLDKTLSLYKVNVPSNDEDDTQVEAEDFDPYADTVDFEVTIQLIIINYSISILSLI
jgi:hypothetical protein